MTGSFFRMCFRVFLTGVIIAKNGTGKKDKWVVLGEKGRKRSWAGGRRVLRRRGGEGSGVKFRAYDMGRGSGKFFVDFGVD